MAYNSYFPQYYQPFQQTPVNAPQMAQAAPQQSNSGIIWVQGEAAAKSFPVGAGQAVLLMDSEASVMYIKSTDASGMPQPLRIFDYTERTAAPSEAAAGKAAPVDYVSRDEFDAFKEEMKKSIKGIRKPKLLEDEDE